MDFLLSNCATIVIPGLKIQLKYKYKNKYICEWAIWLLTNSATKLTPFSDWNLLTWHQFLLPLIISEPAKSFLSLGVQPAFGMSLHNHFFRLKNVTNIWKVVKWGGEVTSIPKKNCCRFLVYLGPVFGKNCIFGKSR